MENYTNQIKVSVIVPIYNMSKFLSQTLDSLAAQTLKEVEFICVDDASTDNSPEIIKSYASVDPRFVPILLKINGSASQARKAGVLSARGEYIMFLDGDDYFNKDTCEKAYACITERNVDMLQFKADIICDDSSANLNWFKIFNEMKVDIFRGTNSEMLHQCFVNTQWKYTLWNKIYRREICQRAFGAVKDEPFYVGNDVYAFFLICSYACSYASTDSFVGVNYCYGRGIHKSGGITMSRFRDYCRMSDIIRNIQDFVEERGLADECAGSISALADTLLNDCSGRLMTVLPQSVRPEALQLLCQSWGVVKAISALARKDWIASYHLIKNIGMTPAVWRGEIRTIGLYCGQMSESITAQTILNLTSMFYKKGYNIVLLDSNKSMTNNSFDVDDVQRFTIPATDGPENYRQHAAAIAFAIEKYSIDVVIYHTCNDDNVLPFDVMLIKEIGAACILNIHTPVQLFINHFSNHLGSLYWASRISDGVVCDFRTDEPFWKCANANAAWIPFVCPPTTGYATLDGNTILWMGNLDDLYGISEIMGIFSRIAKSVPDATLILGDISDSCSSKLSVEVKNLIASSEYASVISVSPPSVSIDKICLKSDLLLNTSRLGVLYPKLKCACVCGLPSVSYDLDDVNNLENIPGVVRVPMGDHISMAAEVLRLLSDRDALIEAGEQCRRIMDDAETVLEKWLTLFNNIEMGRINNVNNTDISETDVLSKLFIKGYTNGFTRLTAPKSARWDEGISLYEFKKTLSDQLEYARYAAISEAPLIEQSAVDLMRIFPISDRSAAFDFMCKTCGSVDAIAALFKKNNNHQEELVNSVCKASVFLRKPSKIKTIGIYYSRLDNGGVQRVMSQMSFVLTDLNYKVVVITENQPCENDFILPSGVERVVLSIGNNTEVDQYAMRAHRLQHIIMEYHIDFVDYHKHFSPTLVLDLMVIKSTGTACAIHMHSASSWTLSRQTNFIGIQSAAAKIADTIVDLSRVDNIFWHGSNHNATFIPNPSEGVIARLPQAQLNGCNLLWVGRISDEKLPLDAVRAFEVIVNEIPNARLTIVGSANLASQLPLENKLRKEIEDLGLSDRVSMAGFSTNVEEYYLKSDLLLCTSSAESFSLVLMEACSYGLPIISYDMPYLEIIQKCSGIKTVPQRDYISMGVKAVELLNNRDILKANGAACRRDILTLYEKPVGEMWRELIGRIEKGVSIDAGSPSFESTRIMLEAMLDSYILGCKAIANRFITSAKKSKPESTPSLNNLSDLTIKLVNEDRWQELFRLIDKKSRRLVQAVYFGKDNRSHLSIRLDSIDSETSEVLKTFEAYNLPDVDHDLEKNTFYNILTSKKPVTVNQGGTGAVKAAQACDNLGALNIGEALVLDDGTDLDELLTPGTAVLINNGNKHIVNCPDRGTFKLVVDVISKGFVRQTLMQAGTSASYMRYYAGQRWSNWTASSLINLPNLVLKLMSKDRWQELFRLEDMKNRRLVQAVYFGKDNRTHLSIRVDSVDSGTLEALNTFEAYNFPDIEHDLEENYFYDILTSKKPVTVSQGGTGAAKAAEACNNLGAFNIGEANMLENGADLNELLDPCTLVLINNGVDKCILNCPEIGMFKLVVDEIRRGSVRQTLMQSGTYTNYMRYYSGQLWSDWIVSYGFENYYIFRLERFFRKIFRKLRSIIKCF